MGSIRTAAPTTAVVPAQAKTDALTEFGLHHLLHAPSLLALPTGGYYRLSEFPDKGNVAAAISNDGAWNLGIVSNLPQGSVGSIRWEFEQIIGSRDWIVLTYEYRAGGTGRIVMWDPLTLQVLDEVPSLGSGPWPALTTAAGSGTLYIGGLGFRGHDARYDAVWITAPGAPLQRPTAAQCIAFYGFSGFVQGGPQPATTPDSIAGGTPLTLGNATLLDGGLWDSPASGGGGGGGSSTTLGGDLSESAVAGRATFSGAVVDWT